MATTNLVPGPSNMGQSPQPAGQPSQTTGDKIRALIMRANVLRNAGSTPETSPELGKIIAFLAACQEHQRRQLERAQAQAEQHQSMSGQSPLPTPTENGITPSIDSPSSAPASPLLPTDTLPRSQSPQDIATRLSSEMAFLKTTYEANFRDLLQATNNMRQRLALVEGELAQAQEGLQTTRFELLDTREELVTLREEHRRTKEAHTKLKSDFKTVKAKCAQLEVDQEALHGRVLEMEEEEDDSRNNLLAATLINTMTITMSTR
ncbi:hypothetical protein EIP91_001049 [Steccherinum ochraceum]|uniref:Uncharacterized protein n=1 Tax=Steccherinum ochraceum TaxID=92696 RepID=A0A4R0RL56_9APHY|nr:hypothetical protein EIP91_001049 [Steccherinum ochraceum]